MLSVMSDQGSVRSVWVKLDNDVKEIAVSQDDSIKTVIFKAVGQSNTPKCARFNGKTFKRTEVVKDLPITTKENPMEIFEGKKIFQHGLPPAALFGETTFSLSTKSKSKSHQPAQFLTRKFVILDAAREKKSSTFESAIIWMKHNRRAAKSHMGSLIWGSEADLCHIVMDLLSDVSEETGVDELHCMQQFSLFEAFKPDIRIVCVFDIPIGLIGVKSSLESIPPLDNPLCFGQIYDYLTYLKECLGIQSPFGILTTYDEWRIVWLPESDDYATASSHDQLPAASTDYPSHVQGPQYDLMDLDPPNWDKNPALHISSAGSDITKPMAADLSLAHVQSTAASDDSQNRVLHGTGIISWNDPELSFILVSCLQKMNASPRNSIKTVSLQPSRSYIFVSKDKWQWKKPRTSVSLHVKSTIPSNVDDAFLLADLGGWGDGRVWLGSTAGGEVFVAKFSENESSLQQEKELWESVWNCSTRVTHLNNYSVLLMPWIKPCNTKQELNDEVKAAAKQAIKVFANAGYHHDDLKWSHVGLYMKDNKLQALLFDLARVTKIEPPELAEEYMFHSLMKQTIET